MTEEIITVEENPETAPEATEEPQPEPGGPAVTVRLEFESTTAAEPAIYQSVIASNTPVTAEQFAKQVAETVERTALLHLGALPVLAKQEVSA